MYLFCARLRELGATVLGLADPPFEALRPELRDVLTEYYRVPDLHDLDADGRRMLPYEIERLGV